MTSSGTERDELRQVVRQLLDDRSTEADVRRVMASESGVDHELWSTMAREIGLQGLGLPERYGGADAGWAELAVVFEELGRVTACVPYLGTVGLAVPALLAAGDDEASARWLPGIAAGSVIATVAALGRRRASADDIPVRARQMGERWHLDGLERWVLDAPVADVVLVPAQTDGGLAMFAVERADLRVESVRTSDQTRRFGHVTLDKSRATVVGGVGDGLRLVAAARSAAALALGWEQAGGATATLDMAVDYAKVRHQFGRPIGSFQAVKHLCADMLVAVESARAAAWGQLRSVEDDADDLPLVAALARVVCSERYQWCATTNVQVHGGIGFTWEHPAHLHVKRSRGSAVLLGTPLDNRELLADLVPALTSLPPSSKGTP